MNVLIIEDEENLARQLQKMLLEIDPEVNILSMIGSVKDAVAFINGSDEIDLMLVDIYLSDGLSFDIFTKAACKSPVIFCTAYDQYALKAFEVDSVDYLLKPIKKADLQKSVDKYKRLFTEKAGGEFPKLAETIQGLYKRLSAERSYQKNFLLPHKDRLVPVSIEEISHFQAEYGMAKCVTKDGRVFPVDQSLDALAEKLDPDYFYRVNRQFMVKRDAIIDVEYYFNGRLYLNIIPKPKESILISKAKATDFKNWMNKV